MIIFVCVFFFIQIWSGSDILKDGQCILECYGGSLDVLNEGDCVGIMRTSDGNLLFSVNGESKGIAASGLNAKPIWAVVSRKSLF